MGKVGGVGWGWGWLVGGEKRRRFVASSVLHRYLIRVADSHLPVSCLDQVSL